MQNGPIEGNANPDGINSPASLAAAREAGRYSDSEQEMNEEEKEKDTKPEDFESFNVEKVDELNKEKEDYTNHE
ncbi:hypothetical protein [Marinilactibacillus kalidii]|uniref:hypothetical protein n=1 Tax=Marinilactibacillus kalidii TaxID=2820274 RepID=UPI001ABE76BB|nr:hypothetical protein [Marinilactibacillus kalidii]